MIIFMIILANPKTNVPQWLFAHVILSYDNQNWLASFFRQFCCDLPVDAHAHVISGSNNWCGSEFVIYHPGLKDLFAQSPDISIRTTVRTSTRQETRKNWFGRSPELLSKYDNRFEFLK